MESIVRLKKNEVVVGKTYLYMSVMYDECDLFAKNFDGMRVEVTEYDGKMAHVKFLDFATKTMTIPFFNLVEIKGA